MPMHEGAHHRRRSPDQRSPSRSTIYRQPFCLSVKTPPSYQRKRGSNHEPQKRKTSSAFTEAIRKMSKKDHALMAVTYLFAADGRRWNCVSRYVDRCEIAFERICLTNTNEARYTLFCCTKDLALGTKHLIISDLADADLIPSKLFGVICDAMSIRRYDLGAIQFK